MGKVDSKKEYIRRINIVQDYIDTHSRKELSLEELADVAGFSKYHFHRIFKAMTKQSVSQYTNRIKLERAAQLLSHRMDLSITDIAYHLGFTDSAVFSRSFKNLYQVSPNKYRTNYRKNCKDQYTISRYNESVSNMEKEKITGQVEIVTLKTLTVGYLRFTGRYEQLANTFSDMLNRLFESASKQELIAKDTKVIAMYHDHPEFTNPDHYKTSLCITLPEGVQVLEDSDICVMEIPAGEYLVGHFYIHQHQYSAAWDYIYEEWLTKSGYVPRDEAPFEIYMNNYLEDPKLMHVVDIYLPVEPL